MKKLATVVAMLLVVSLLVMGLLGCAPEAPVKAAYLGISTASTGGTWYPAGGGMASIITKYVPNAEAIAHPSASSLETVRLLGEGKTHLGMAMPDIAYYAKNGLEMYKGKPQKIEGLFSFWPIDQLLITREETGITKMEDLRGKKVAVGLPGSGTYVFNTKMLDFYGMSIEDDITPLRISATEASAALKDKSADAAMYVLGTPSATMIDLCTLTKCRIIQMTEDDVEKLSAKLVGYYSHIIPGGSYPQIDYDALTLAWYGLVLVVEGFDPDLAYNITKAICKDHLDEFKTCHAMAKGLTTEGMMTGMTVEWNPGSARFWKEEGLLK